MQLVCKRDDARAGVSAVVDEIIRQAKEISEDKWTPEVGNKLKVLLNFATDLNHAEIVTPENRETIGLVIG
jgi:hypothetical protein